jgi:hypothetical protein
MRWAASIINLINYSLKEAHCKRCHVKWNKWTIRYYGKWLERQTCKKRWINYKNGWLVKVVGLAYSRASNSQR